jgi:TRAP-type C4-dicarboxylate transport system substrate-binding protein
MEKRNKLWMGVTAVMFSLLVGLSASAAAAASPEKATSWIFQLYVTAKDSPEALTATKFVDEVDKRSNGRLKIKPYLAGTLGFSGTELANVCAKGAVNMAVATGQATASIDPIFSAVDEPFRFPKLTFEYDKIEPRLALVEAKPIFDRHAEALGLVNLGNIVYPKLSKIGKG